MKQFNTIGLIGRAGKKTIMTTLYEVINFLSAQKKQILLNQSTADLLDKAFLIVNLACVLWIAIL